MGEETGGQLRGMGVAALVARERAEKRILENLLKLCAHRAGGVITMREKDITAIVSAKLEINEYPEMQKKELGALIEIRVTGVEPAAIVVSTELPNN